jgi:hypothetical protein
MATGIAVSVRLDEDIYADATKKAHGAGMTFQNYLRTLLAWNLGRLDPPDHNVTPPVLGPVPRPPKGGDR